MSTAPATIQTAPAPSSNASRLRNTKKGPPCPECQCANTIRKGKRRNRMRSLQVYQCGECLHRFALGDASKHKSYPLKTILETISTFNRGHSVTETQAILRRRLIFRYQNVRSAHGSRSIDLLRLMRACVETRNPFFRQAKSSGAIRFNIARSIVFKSTGRNSTFCFAPLGLRISPDSGHILKPWVPHTHIICSRIRSTDHRSFQPTSIRRSPARKIMRRVLQRLRSPRRRTTKNAMKLFSVSCS